MVWRALHAIFTQRMSLGCGERYCVLDGYTTTCAALLECCICCRMTPCFPSHPRFPPRCRCGEWVRLPLITPCCHLLCFLCVKSNKLACALPGCGLPYRMQASRGEEGGGGREGLDWRG